MGHPSGLIRDALRMCNGALVEIDGPSIDAMLAQHPEYERTIISAGTYVDYPAEVTTLGVRTVIVTTTRMSDARAYEITKAVFDNFEDFRRLHPLFATLSIESMVGGERRVPIHPGAARYYRERGWK